jgi:hypothetical protein
VLVLAGPPAFFYELLKKVLEAQSVVESMLYIALGRRRGPTARSLSAS